MAVVRGNNAHVPVYAEAILRASRHEKAKMEVSSIIGDKLLDFLRANEPGNPPKPETIRDYMDAVKSTFCMTESDFERSVRDGSARDLPMEKYLPLVLRDCVTRGKHVYDDLASGNPVYDDVGDLSNALDGGSYYDGKHRALMDNPDGGYFLLDKDTARVYNIMCGYGGERELSIVHTIVSPSGVGVEPHNDPEFSSYLAKFHYPLALFLNRQGMLELPEPTLAERNSVSPLQYDKAMLDYRNGIVNVFRFAAKLAKPEGEGRFLPLDIPGIKGAEGLWFTSAGSSTAVSLRFEDGSVLRSSHISTMDLKEIKRGLDSFIAKEKMKRNQGKGKDHDKGKGI